MRPISASLALLACVLPAPALDISGVVANKIDEPIPLAQVCLRNFPDRCVSSSMAGAFRITDAGLAVSIPGPALPYSLELLGARMAFTAPDGGPARILWLDASGRVLAPERETVLRPGRNLLDLPRLPADGLHFVRIALPGLTLSWKALMLGSGEWRGGGRVGADGPASRGGPLAALSKAAAAPSDLVVTAPGFRPSTYRPSRQVETDAYVVLTPLSDSGFVYTSSYTSKSTLDRDKGQWVTEDTVTECNGPIPVKTVYRDTSRYAVRDGKLYQYYPGQCRGELLTGDGDDVLGDWDYAESNVFLPADLRPDACRDTVPSDPVPPTVKGTVTISETDQSFAISAELCPPDFYLDLFLQLLVTDPTVGLVRNTCRQVGFRNGDGEEASLGFSRQGDSLIGVFTAGDRSCRIAESTVQSGNAPVDCLATDPVDVFLVCVAATAYFGELGPAPRAKAGTRDAASRKAIAVPRKAAAVRRPAPTGWHGAKPLPGKVYISHP